MNWCLVVVGWCALCQWETRFAWQIGCGPMDSQFTQLLAKRAFAGGAWYLARSSSVHIFCDRSHCKIRLISPRLRVTLGRCTLCMWLKIRYVGLGKSLAFQQNSIGTILLRREIWVNNKVHTCVCKCANGICIVYNLYLSISGILDTGTWYTFLRVGLHASHLQSFVNFT